MHFSGEDIFVGAIGILLGATCLYGSLTQSRWFFQLRKVRWLESRFGRTAARWSCVALAAALILFGGAIAMGFSLQRILEPERSATGYRFPSQRSARYLPQA